MTNKKRDLSKFVDRKDQLAYFEQLLNFEDDVRILAIQDKPGMGKTYFLQKLYSYCRTLKPRVPVVMVDFRELVDTSPFSLIRKVWQDLKNYGELIPVPDEFSDTFVADSPLVNNLSINMLVKDNYFENEGDVNILSEIGGVEADLYTQLGDVLTSKKIKKDKKNIDQVFLDGLRDYCKDKPVVILLDHYEHCSDENLKNWMTNYFLEQYFFDVGNRPKKLVLVITGREGGLPRFVDNWSDTACQQTVRWIESLGTWPFDEFLRFIDLCQASVSQEDLEKIYGLMNSGFFTTERVSALVEDRARQNIRNK